MKRALIAIGIILVSLTIMAPAPENAEKLRHDDNQWDYQWSYDDKLDIFSFDDGTMSAKYGIATAAEANGMFKAALFIVGEKWNHESNGWESWSTTTSEVDIVKVDEPIDGYYILETKNFEWNGDDDGSCTIAQAFKISDIGISLITPGGSAASTTYAGLTEIVGVFNEHCGLGTPCYPGVIAH